MDELIKIVANNSTNKLANFNEKPRTLSPEELREMNLVLSWLGSSSKGDPKAENTKRNYGRDIKEFLSYHPGRRLKFMGTADISAYLEQWSGEGIEASTFNRRLAAIRSLFQFLFKAQYIDKNPAQLIQFKRVRDKTAERLIFPDQVKRMIEFEPGERNKTLIYLLYKIGARCEEVTKIQRQHLVVRGESAYLILMGKGNKTRMILIDDKLHEKILSLFQTQSINRPKHFPKGTSGSYLFQSGRTGEKLSTTQIYRIIKTAALRAGLSDRVSPHWLRHGHATEARRRGADLRQIQMQLGHSSIQTTEKYTHVMAEDSTTGLVDI